MEPQKSPSTVQELATHLLCEVAYWEDRREGPEPNTNRVPRGHTHARSVGFPYAEILKKIRISFPNCGTNVASLYWYAVKIRMEEHGYENMALPQRRSKAQKKEKMQ